MAISRNGEILYLACERSHEIAVISLTAKQKIGCFPLDESPSGLVLADYPPRLIVTCSGRSNTIVSLDCETGRVLDSKQAGKGVSSPMILAGRNALFTCNRYENTVSLIDLDSDRELVRRPVQREPIAASVAADGHKLAIANFLPAGAANRSVVRVPVTIMSGSNLETEREIWLPNGSTCVRALAFHPIKNLCAVIHNIARFQLPTTQVEHGWMNVSALSLFSAEDNDVIATIVLDEARRGAANPWAIAWAADGNYLCIAHAGTHELSVINAEALQEKLVGIPKATFISDFSFLEGIRTRVALAGNGPRAVVVREGKAYVAEFFSDSVSVVDLKRGTVLYSVAFGTSDSTDRVREGERLFHDATIGHQYWQSCASCHPDGRVDGLNWDLRNDGIGNPKNTKSLLLAHQTPPAMTLGGRGSAEAAVRSGLRHIHFAIRPESEATAIDEYLRSLDPVASPHLFNGTLTQSALRGKRIFEDSRIGCATCHLSPLFTDLKRHRLEPPGAQKATQPAIDTPALVECWRTAPYLHDGSAATIREMLTIKNPGDTHGTTSHLSAQEIEDLTAYVLSL